MVARGDGGFMSLREVQVWAVRADETLARLAIVALRQRISIQSVDVHEDPISGTFRISLVVAIRDEAAGARFLAGLGGMVDVTRVAAPDDETVAVAAR
jgi:hypothetical protein